MALLNLNRSTSCRRCHKRLRNPASIQVGMGPTCARKSGAAARADSTEPTYYRSGPAPLPPGFDPTNPVGTYYAAFPDPATDGSGGKVQPVFGVRITVTTSSETATHLHPCLDLERRSPTGFNYGYGGSGPSQLALAILVDFFGRESPGLWNARLLYMDFKAEFLCDVEPPTPLIIAAQRIQEWVKPRLAEVAA